MAEPVAAVSFVALLATTLASCSGSGRDRDPGDSTAVSFESTDGVRLEGRVFGTGPSAVVLSHMRPADQSSWFGFARRLAEGGYLVLTYNFRGYCPGGDAGCSEGRRDIAQIWRDVLGAIGFLRAEYGVGRVSLVGASMGGTASLMAAAETGIDVDSVISLSAPASFEGLVADQGVLGRSMAAKLFIAGVGDASAATAAELLYQQSPPPKRVEVVPSDEHGTDLLSGGQGEVVARLIETYLETSATA